MLSGSFRIYEAVVERSDAAFGEANFRYDNLFGELLGNLFGNINRRSLKSLSFLSVTIWQSNYDLTCR